MFKLPQETSTQVSNVVQTPLVDLGPRIGPENWYRSEPAGRAPGSRESQNSVRDLALECDVVYMAYVLNNIERQKLHL